MAGSVKKRKKGKKLGVFADIPFPLLIVFAFLILVVLIAFLNK